MTQDADAQKQQLVESMRYLTDCLAFAVGPSGNLLYLPDDVRVQLAWHLARTGAGRVDGQAIIERQVLPDRPGQIAGTVAWVPIGTSDPDPVRTASTSAQGDPIDPSALDDILPWHVKTKIEGDFR